MSHFPIEILILATNERKIISTSKHIPNGIAFQIVKTSKNLKSDIDRNKRLN